MKLPTGLLLSLCFAVSIVVAQKLDVSSNFSTDEKEESVSVLKTDLVNLKVSVWSSEKGYLTNLTFRNFQVYAGQKIQRVEFLNFDKSAKKYNIGYYPEIPATRKKRREVKLKIKLSAEEKKEFGKIIVDRQKWILLNRN